MARYFFHLRDHTDQILDLEGVQLPSVDAVKPEALRAARDTLSHEIKDGVVDLRYRIDVEDAGGRIVHSLPLRDAFEVIEG